MMMMADAALPPPMPDAARPMERPPVDAMVPPLQQGLVAWWKMDETAGASTASDSSGNHNDGALSLLDPQKAWAAGQVGGAIWVLGPGKAVLVKSSESLNTMSGAFTISAWIKKDMPRSNLYRAVVSRQLGGGKERLFTFGFFDGRLLVRGDKLGGELRSPGDPLPLVTDWGHVVATYDGTTVRLYLAGAEIANMARNGGSIGPGTTPVVIGGSQLDGTGAFTETMDGYIDDLRLYNRALSPAEVKMLAQ
jgi:hypothetical protein